MYFLDLRVGGGGAFENEPQSFRVGLQLHWERLRPAGDLKFECT